MSLSAVIVTGAANGIGAAIVRSCLDAESVVVACDIDRAGLEALEARHRGRPLDVRFCDVGVRADCEAFMDGAIADHPNVDGLVNNAGLYLGQPVTDYDDDVMERVIAVNVKGPVWLSRRFAGHVLPQKRRGAIVNFASVAGEVGSSDAIYGMVKAGVIGLTKSNAMNFAPLIRVNVVSPGLIVDTAIAGRIPKYRYEEYKRQERLDGDIYPRDVAAVCSFLLSDAARNMTGAVVPVDNGCYPR